MDLVLIISMVAIVIVVGYILSRPFLSATGNQETHRMVGDYESQYQLLLKEIKTLENEHKPDEIPQEICDQLEEKKKQAAELLRLINPPL